MSDDPKPCTCPPDAAQNPCPQRYAATDCRIAALEAELAALRALPPVHPDPLGAEWMRREASRSLSDVADKWSCGHDAMHCDCARDIEQWHIAADEILAIPGPTPDDLDRAALARPKVRALVEAATAYAFENDCYDEETPSAMAAWRSARAKLDAALAALKGGE